MSDVRRRAIPILIVALGLASCARTTASRPPGVSPAPAPIAGREAQAGSAADRELRREAWVPADAPLGREARQIAARLSAGFGTPAPRWRVLVLDFGAPNAFALPGGHVYLTRGLFPYLSSRDELAAVIAHEMAHVLLGDDKVDYLAGSDSLPADLGVFRPIARLFGGPLSPAVTRALFASRDPARERAASERASMAMGAAGFDPFALDAVLETLDRVDLETDERGVPAWGMTHGRGYRLDADWIARARAAAPAARPAKEAGDFLGGLDGLLFGDDPRLGLVRVNEVTLPGLRIAVTVPAEWDVSSDEVRMIAASPNQDAFIVLQFVPSPEGRSVAATAEALALRAGLLTPKGRPATIGGMIAFVGTTSGPVAGLGQARVQIACLQAPGGQFVVGGFAGAGADAEVGREIAAAIRSVRELSAAESSQVRPERVAIETAGPGETWDAIARRHGGVVMGTTLAVLNHGDRDKPVAAGTRIKVVVASER